MGNEFDGFPECIRFLYEVRAVICNSEHLHMPYIDNVRNSSMIQLKLDENSLKYAGVRKLLSFLHSLFFAIK